MKKLITLSLMISAVFVFVNCGSQRKTASSAPAAAASTYENHIQTAVMAYCTPCHVPEKGGNKKAYDNYANVKADIDEIIRRIELNPTDRGFMPFKKAKLADSTIAVFKKWKEDGLVEK